MEAPSAKAEDYEGLEWPKFSVPVEVGGHSTDQHKRYLHDRSQLRFLAAPQILAPFPWNLDSNFHSYTPDNKDTYLSLLLRWAETEQKQTGRRLPEILHNAEFLSLRGSLSRVGLTPYVRRNSWRLAIVRYRDIFFIGEFWSPGELQQKANMSQRDHHMTYWGHRFESFLCADDKGRLDLNSPINRLEHFCLIVKSQLGDHRLLFSGEVDCLDRDSKEYVELKTNRWFQSERQVENFNRHKAVKWWLQSTLIGVPRIIAGLRDDDGLVRELREWRTRDLHPPGKTRSWKGSVCLHFIASLLQYLKDSIRVNDIDQVWMVEKVDREDAIRPLRKLSGSENQQFTFLSPREKTFLRTAP